MTRLSEESQTLIVECLASPADTTSVLRGCDRLRSACAEMQAAGTAIEYLGALLVPEDELVLHMFLSAGPDVVRHVSVRCALRVERIVRALAIGTAPNHGVVVPGLVETGGPRRTARARGADRRR